MINLALACRSAVGVVFLVSAASKPRGRPALRAFVSWLGALPVPLVRSQPRATASVIGAAEALIASHRPWCAGPYAAPGSAGPGTGP